MRWGGAHLLREHLLLLLSSLGLKAFSKQDWEEEGGRRTKGNPSDCVSAPPIWAQAPLARNGWQWLCFLQWDQAPSDQPKFWAHLELPWSWRQRCYWVWVSHPVWWIWLESQSRVSLSLPGMLPKEPFRSTAGQMANASPPSAETFETEVPISLLGNWRDGSK